MILGITGGTGCGKTTLLKLLEAQGALIIDCDAVYHQLLETDQTMLQEIGSRFPGVIQENKLDRKKLGSIVFADPKALQDLNTITHKAVKQAVLKLLETAPDLVGIDAIGLFEGGLAELCQLTVAVTAPEDVRIARLMAREGISREYASARIAAQRPQSEFSALCDVTLENNGTLEDFQKKCLAFFRQQGIMILGN